MQPIGSSHPDCHVVSRDVLLRVNAICQIIQIEHGWRGCEIVSQQPGVITASKDVNNHGRTKGLNNIYK